MIKAVIFDIDNTLYDFDRTHEIGLQAVTDYMVSNYDLEEKQVKEVYDRAMKEANRRIGMDCAAIHSRTVRFEVMLELLNISKWSEVLKLYHLYWDTLIDAMEPEPGVIDFIRELHRRGIALGIGTDMTAHIQYKKLLKLGILDLFTGIITSEEAGAEKPSPRFFQLCLDKMGCAPEECVFIGDNVNKDILGAELCGMHPLWYVPHVKEYNEEQYPVLHSFEDAIRYINI